MILSTPVLTIFKYSFLGLVVTGAGFLIANTAVTMRYKSVDGEVLPYRAQINPRSVSLPLNRNSVLCLLQPSSRPFCQMSAKKRLKLLKNQHSSTPAAETTNSTVSYRPSHPLYLLMKDFVDFAGSLGTAPVLLEPSILFCMLSTLQKYYAISNNLQTTVLQSSTNTVTFGVFENDARALVAESSINKSSEFGFDFSRRMRWMDENGELADTSFFFSRQNLTVIVLVFFQRETFVWHPSEEQSQFHPPAFESRQAFENFTAVPFVLKIGEPSGFHLPSDVTQFLLQIQKSTFEDCQPLSNSQTTPATRSALSYEQLSQRADIAIQELKSVLRPKLMTFWLWNDTLSGWEENCDIFQKTSEFEVAVAVPVSVVPKTDLNITFADNEYLRVVEYYKWDDILFQVLLDCYGMLIRISVFYEDHDSMWNYEKDFSGNLTRNSYSRLQLCSASVLGHLVHKPCSNQTLL